MTVTVAGIDFEHHDYDARADVLYLTAEGYAGPPADAYASPEGHGIEYDEARRVVAMTLVNVRSVLDRDGGLTITWPAGHVGAADLVDVLVPAA